MRIIDEDIAIIRREFADLEAGIDPVQALATIAQAVHHAQLLVDPQGNACARITHHNGHLIGRYTQQEDQ